MASLKELYNSLYEGPVKVKIESKAQYETLRTALIRKNRLSVLLDITDKSIVASYDGEKQIGQFSLALSKRNKFKDKWEVISDEAPIERLRLVAGSDFTPFDE